MTVSPKYYIKGNLSEKQIEADVASFFGWCTPPEERSPFRLLDIDEQRTGADKLYDRATAIYMQFKKSNGLKSTKIVKPSTRKGRSRLEDIREFRDRHELDQDPTLFFQLRAKAKTALDLQHNVLLAYERPYWSRAIYVAPLLLNKSDYHAALHNSANRFLLDPFFYRIRHSVYQQHWVSHFGTVPFLREHISIPPHERVADHNHYYAYSEAGVDISWHSPSIIEREPSRLSDFTVKLFRTAITHEDSMLSIEKLASHIEEISSRFGFTNENGSKNNSAIEYLGRHGRWLRETHGIHQFILLGNSKILDDLRREF
ncbi:hypothetical protein [Aeromonas veronii]|uniref:hypothetical protein n=1 Tax=Aeromonas veronii TaxID=654 RepID=UPI0035B7D3D3